MIAAGQLCHEGLDRIRLATQDLWIFARRVRERRDLRFDFAPLRFDSLLDHGLVAPYPSLGTPRDLDRLRSRMLDTRFAVLARGFGRLTRLPLGLENTRDGRLDQIV